jgi:hypothetical protein
MWQDGERTELQVEERGRNETKVCMVWQGISYMALVKAVVLTPAIQNCSKPRVIDSRVAPTLLPYQKMRHLWRGYSVKSISIFCLFDEGEYTGESS